MFTSDIDPNLMYLGVRPTSNFSQGPVGTSQSMTQEIFRNIKTHEGARFQFSFWSAQQINPSSGSHTFYKFKDFDATLVETKDFLTDIKAMRSAQNLPLSQSDGVYGFDFLIDDQSAIALLYERRDPNITSATAQKNLSVHWGTQDWGGLFLLLSFKNKLLFQSAVDMFFNDHDAKISNHLHVIAYSQDPTAPTGREPYHQKTDIDGIKERLSKIERPKLIHPETIGKCTKCGAKLEIESVLLAVTNRNTDSLIMHSCASCGEPFKMKILSENEERRRGYKYQVITSN